MGPPSGSEFRRAGAIALDRALGGKAADWPLRLALDRGSVRSYSVDGHLHISDAAISKAEVNFYTGAELLPNIPGGARTGLDPDRRYPVLRPPEELQKAAPSFALVPLLWGHKPLNADSHPAELVVGTTGSDVRFAFPWLRCSLVVWSAVAINAIEDGTDNLSAAYRYTAVPEAGVFRGAQYLFRMTGIIGNHLACVDRGRVSGAVIGDSMPGPREFMR